MVNGIGVYCDCCGVCADPECVKKANLQLKCKLITSGTENQLHHWVKGRIQYFLSHIVNTLGKNACLCYKKNKPYKYEFDKKLYLFLVKPKNIYSRTIQLYCIYSLVKPF